MDRGGAGTYGWNMGNTNSSGQVPDIPNLPSLIDAHTPDDVKYGIRTGYDGKQYQLVFSDEFNEDGRTFFPGDDPFVSDLAQYSCLLEANAVPDSGRLSTSTTGKPEIWSGMTQVFQ